MEYVHNFLFADTEAHVSLGLTFGILVLDTDVKALLVKVRSGLVIVEIFKLLGDVSILL